MFGVIGRKKTMLANYRRAESTGLPVDTLVREEKRVLRETRSLDDISINSNTSSRKNRHPQSSVRNHYELERILQEDTIAGGAVRKVANAASKFVKERDYVLISAFETSALDYHNFRILLKRQFSLTFSDDEFVEVCAMFDSNDDKEVDGGEFIVVFTILANIMKNELRRRQRERKAKDEEAFRKMEEARAEKKENYIDTAVDYNFTEADRESALNKIDRAAEKYDRTHHSARSIKTFEQLRMNPVEFRDSLKGSFEVVLSPQELGAAIMHYNKGEPGFIMCQEFIVGFLRHGYAYRMKHRTEQIMETRQSEEEAREAYEKKVLRNVESLEDAGVDFDFEPPDEQSMVEKIRTAAGKYDRNHPGAVSLAGFDAKYLTPGAFRLTLLRTFNVTLTNRELGALTKMFDRKNNETICNHDFLVYFTRAGYQVRSQKRAAQLKMERSAVEQANHDHEKKMFAQWKIDNAHFDPDAFTKTDAESAMRKLKREASRYHSEHVSAPDFSVFNGADMNVAEFREMIKRQIGLTFSYPELASLLPIMGSKTNRCAINTASFLNTFKSIGWKERQKRRAIQLKLLAEQQKKLEDDKLNKRERMTRQMNDIVDYNFSQAEMDSAVAKMTQAAYKYDKNHPGSSSLEGFMGRSMEPGIFSRMVKHTFHVKLTGKELGAIVSIYDADGDGHIDSAEFLSNFFFMQRECKEAVRKQRVEKKKKMDEAEKAHLMEKERLKFSKETARLKFTADHEKELLKKLIVVGKKFAIDNASYLGAINIFKGPAMNGSAFQAAFFRIFLQKLSLPEIGALMYNLNPKMFDINVVDGPAFVTMLQKLGRMCEEVLLGNASEDSLTFENLQIVKEVNVSGGGLSRSPSSSISRSSSSVFPAISPAKQAQQLYEQSPAMETYCTLRGVTRGAGEDDAFVFSHEGFYEDGASVESYGASHSGDDRTRSLIVDPYAPYMKLSPLVGFNSPMSPATVSSMSPSIAPFSPDQFSHTSESCRSPNGRQLSPLRTATSIGRFDATDCSVTSEITFSPIKSAVSKPRTSSSASMVSNLIGTNPWTEQLEQQKSRHRDRSKTAGSRSVHS